MRTDVAGALVAGAAAALIAAFLHRPVSAPPSDLSWVARVAMRCPDAVGYVEELRGGDGVLTASDVGELRSYVAAAVRRPRPGKDCRVLRSIQPA